MDGRTTAAVACVVAGNAWLLLAVTVVFAERPSGAGIVPSRRFGRSSFLLRTPGATAGSRTSPRTRSCWPRATSGTAVGRTTSTHAITSSEVCASREPEVRRASVAALAHLGHRHEWAIDGLIEALAEHADSPASVAAQLDRVAPRAGRDSSRCSGTRRASYGRMPSGSSRVMETTWSSRRPS